MPQVQIFFVSMPANIYLGFVLLMLLLTPIMMWYLDHFSMGIKEFIR
jgi:flagellar biosynthetic protein FliR